MGAVSTDAVSPPPPTGSPVARLLGRLVPGVGRVVDQIGPFAAAWERDTADALDGRVDEEVSLLAVLGDSTAQGIGAAHHRGGWVGQLHGWLEESTGRRWAVANWSRTGAKVADVLDHQLPLLESAPRRPDLVTVAVGSNDVFWGVMTGSARRGARDLIARLPDPSIVATIPAGGLALRAKRLNRTVRTAASERGLPVADVDRWVRGGTGRMLASDGFHPNERGYERWTGAFGAAVTTSELGRRLGVPDHRGIRRYPRRR